MIVVEGVDNTGKTTLIKRLMRCFPQLEYVKSLGPATEREMIDFVMKYFEMKDNKNIIFDRFPLIVESVYGPVVRDACKIHHDRIVKLDKLFRRQRPLIIYCDRSLEDILKTFHEREQMEGVEDKIEALKAYYELRLSFFTDCTVRYNYSKVGDYVKVKWQVDKYLREGLII